MFEKQRLTALQLRKQTLLLESDLNRLNLFVQCERLRQKGSISGQWHELRHKLEPWAIWLAPLAGVILAVGIRRSRTILDSVSNVVGLVPPLMTLWRTFATEKQKTEPAQEV